jgi:hypothetical protein
LSEKEKDIQQSNKSEETIFHLFMLIIKIQMAQEHKMLMENHKTLVSDNWMNGLFAMLLQKFPTFM